MALGILAMTGCAGYIFYMRSKYEGMGYYAAIETDGKETFKKKTSKWDDWFFFSYIFLSFGFYFSLIIHWNISFAPITTSFQFNFNL